MSQFDLQIKFEQIVSDWKIPADELYSFNRYLSFLKNYKLSVLSNENINFSLNVISESLISLLDLIFTTNYIESNFKKFTVKLDPKERKQLVECGFNKSPFFADNNSLHKHKKDLIFQVNKMEKLGTKKKILRLDFSLLDKKYHLLEMNALSFNISSLINALDKQEFLWNNAEIKHQTNKHDHLFANVNIDIEPKHLCESGVSWLEGTGWAAFIPDVQAKVKAFCSENNYKYHYSYRLSINAANNALKNINFYINENFLSIYKLYIQIRDNINHHKGNSNTKHLSPCKLKKAYKDVFCRTFSLLVKKATCLKQLIYLNNTLLPEFINSEEDSDQ